MGTTTTNLGLNKPTIGGDSGGEDGTDVGGWPQQLNDNFDLLDEVIDELQNTLVELPANAVVVLDRVLDSLIVNSGSGLTDVYDREIASDEILGRSLRFDLLGVAYNDQLGSSTPYLTVQIAFGPDDPLWKGKVPLEFAAANLPFSLSFVLMPVDATTVRLVGFLGVGADASGNEYGTGGPYGAIGPASFIAGSTTADTSVAQDLTVSVEASESSVFFERLMARLIRE